MSDRYRILIAEEDANARAKFRKGLCPHFEVVEAKDGFEALDYMGRIEPDLALVDIDMTMMGGLECCQRMKGHRGFENLPIYLMAEALDGEHARQAYDAGAELCLQKDIDITRLAKNIHISVQKIGPPRRKKRAIEQLANLSDVTPLPSKAPAGPPPSRPDTAPARVSGPKSTPRRLPPDDADLRSDPFPDRVQGERKSKSLRPSGARKPAKIPRLMVVDDDQEALTLIQMALEPEFEVLSATDGILAMERVFDYEPDMFLIDIMMPKMNGYQLVQSLRQMPIYAKSPMVFLTAKSSRRDKQYAEKLRIDGYITKPFDIDKLKEFLLDLTRKSEFRVRAKRYTFREVRRIETERARKKAQRVEQRINRERYQEIDEYVKKATEQEEASTQRRTGD